MVYYDRLGRPGPARPQQWTWICELETAMPRKRKDATITREEFLAKKITEQKRLSVETREGEKDFEAYEVEDLRLDSGVVVPKYSLELELK